ncbi:hypothetical protein D320_00978 [Haloferax sp. BAB-2207]|nr:hypothetical protein D320_00978 [Haloferax sp. BAB-2207]
MSRAAMLPMNQPTMRINSAPTSRGTNASTALVNSAMDSVSVTCNGYIVAGGTSRSPKLVKNTRTVNKIIS